MSYVPAVVTVNVSPPDPHVYDVDPMYKVPSEGHESVVTVTTILCREVIVAEQVSLVDPDEVNAAVQLEDSVHGEPSPMRTLDPAGASLTLATLMVNESVTDSEASETVMTTAWSPTSASPGVPVSAPVEVSKAIQLGTVVPTMVRVSPSSSAPVTVYE